MGLQGQQISTHNTGSGLYGMGGQGIATHSTGPAPGTANTSQGVKAHSTGGYGNLGMASQVRMKEKLTACYIMLICSVQPLAPTNTGNVGSGFNLAMQNNGSGYNTPNKSANDLVNLDASSLRGGASPNQFGGMAAKNPFQTGGSGGNKFQWENPKPAQPTLAQLATTNAAFGPGGSQQQPGGFGQQNAFGGQNAGFGSTGNMGGGMGGNMGGGMGSGMGMGGGNPFGQQGMGGMQTGFNPQQQQPFGGMGGGQGGFQQPQQGGFNQFGAQQQQQQMGSGPFF